MIRRAKKGDEYRILDLIMELAIYEKEPDAVKNTPEKLAKDIFEHKYCEAFVAEVEGQIVGYAIFYTSYSTWNGPCIYLEDIYIQPGHRRTGVGSELFDTVVNIAKERRVSRMDWQILEWNQLALDFYEKKNAVVDTTWLNGRLFFNYED